MIQCKEQLIWTSYYKEANRTDPSPLGSVPWINISMIDWLKVPIVVFTNIEKERISCEMENIFQKFEMLLK